MLSFASSLSFNIEMHKPILMCLLSALKLFWKHKNERAAAVATATNGPHCYVIVATVFCSFEYGFMLTSARAHTHI